MIVVTTTVCILDTISPCTSSGSSNHNELTSRPQSFMCAINAQSVNLPLVSEGCILSTGMYVSVRASVNVMTTISRRIVWR